jgi:hypothetical protein
MKNVLILGMLLLGFNHLKAQDENQYINGYHQHDGFYLSMSSGLVMGNIMDHLTPYSNYSNTVNMNGPGQMNDVKIGWAVSNNLIMHLTVVSNSMVGPSVESQTGRTWESKIIKAPSSLSISEIMCGVGMTYYKMPSNFFFSGSVGIGSFSTRDEKDSKNNDITYPGFSMQLKLGQEWWVSKNWALGAAIAFGKTLVKDRPDYGEAEKLNSSRIAILFNTTFN